MIIHQHKFVKELLEYHSMENEYPVKSPLPSNLKVLYEKAELLSDPTIYRQLVGKLNFLQHTRPDIAFTTQFLSQFNHNPTQNHLNAAFHVLRSLKGTMFQGLFFNNKDDLKLEAFCDSDWAACPNTRRSVSGYFITLGGSPFF